MSRITVHSAHAVYYGVMYNSHNIYNSACVCCVVGTLYIRLILS